VNAWRGRSIESAFADYQWALAARRNRVIALVRVAAPLTPAQLDRLTTSLTSKVAPRPPTPKRWVEESKIAVDNVGVGY